MPAGNKPRAAPLKWDDRWYVRTYEAARAGLDDSEIAALLGLTRQHFWDYRQKKPALKEALELGRRPVRHGGRGKEAVTFFEYVHGRLAPHLAPLWDKLMEYEGNPNALREVEALFQDDGKSARQHLYLHALVKHRFNPSRACQAVGITKHCLEQWAKRDPHFSELLDEMKWHMKNFVEESLMELVARHEPSSVKFAAERLIPEVYGARLKIEGDVKHSHEHTVAVTDLTQEMRLEMLRILREKKQKQLPNGLKELKPEEVQVEPGGGEGPA